VVTDRHTDTQTNAAKNILPRFRGENNNKRSDTYGDVIMAKPLREFTRFIWWMQTKRRLAANPQTKPINLDSESSGNGSYSPHPPSPFIITQS